MTGSIVALVGMGLVCLVTMVHRSLKNLSALSPPLRGALGTSSALIGALPALGYVAVELARAPKWPPVVSERPTDGPWWWDCYYGSCLPPDWQNYLDLWWWALVGALVSAVIAGWIQSEWVRVRHELLDQGHGLLRAINLRLEHIYATVENVDTTLDWVGARLNDLDQGRLGRLGRQSRSVDPAGSAAANDATQEGGN